MAAPACKPAGVLSTTWLTWWKKETLDFLALWGDGRVQQMLKHSRRNLDRKHREVFRELMDMHQKQWWEEVRQFQVAMDRNIACLETMTGLLWMSMSSPGKQQTDS